jgi:hypothetical protein
MFLAAVGECRASPGAFQQAAAASEVGDIRLMLMPMLVAGRRSTSW